MRDLRTVICRVQCDLPITDEEAEALEEHLGEMKKFQKRQPLYLVVALLGILSAIAVIGFVLNLIKQGIS